MNELLSTAVVLLMLLAPGLGVLAWCMVRVGRGEPILDRTPRQPAPWGIIEIGLTALLMIPIQIALVVVAMKTMQIKELKDLTLPQQMAILTAGSLAHGLLAAVAVALAMVRSDDWAADLGWDPREVVGDIQIGAAAFAVLAPITYTLQGLLTVWFPSKHPLIEALRTPQGQSYFPLACMLAVVVAPLAEETLFRWFLQGWMQNLTWPNLEPMVAWLGRPREATYESSTVVQPVALSETDLPPGTIAGRVGNPSYGMQPPDTWLEMWPIPISAAIFALLHVSHGPDWIPLFPFALGLGYLYYRTGRVLPSITVHVLLNGTSMVLLWVALKFGR